MIKSKISRAVALAVVILVLSATLVSAATFILQVSGRATIQGDPSEWGTFDTSNIYYITDLCVAGDCATQPHIARLFMHYTCDNDMIYFAVAANTGLAYTPSATNNWLAQNTVSNIIMNDAPPYTTDTDQNYPIWRDLTTGGSGFEAGYPFARGTTVVLNIQAFVNTTPGGQPTMASTGFHNYVISTCVPTAVTLSSFNAETSSGQWGILLSALGIIGLISIASAGLYVRRKNA